MRRVGPLLWLLAPIAAGVLPGCKATPDPHPRVSLDPSRSSVAEPDGPSPSGASMARPARSTASVVRVGPPASGESRREPADPSLGALSFADLVARLRAGAEAGTDTELASHADLLAAIARRARTATREVVVARDPETEASLRARWGRGTSLATVVTYLEPGADAGRQARALRTIERYQEWTGRTDVRSVVREGEDRVVLVSGSRTGPMGITLGATWRFRMHPVVRGRATLHVIRQLAAPETEHMLETRSLQIVFAEPEGARVVEATASVLDHEAPAALREIILNVAASQAAARASTLRSRWSEVP